MSKYVAKVAVGVCGYEKCQVPYRIVNKGEGAVLILEKYVGLVFYHLECYQAQKKEKSDGH